ncbi:hypothetical protein AMK59_2828 [Oryctes borbonicus]|uniref:Uncharacterized protein n=1 Tax=Oryctes borbonicus TaxID=1629725 RepID=A0A0T6BFM4_9SCAR|nr:hypothetical protein AMK59_2828 [Oryctes borbonicus]
MTKHIFFGNINGFRIRKSRLLFTGAPIIIVLGNHISHISMNLKLYSWWIVIGTASFYIFVICCLILTILYIVMYCIVNRCIKSKNYIKIPKDRVILLRKSLYIFHALILVIISSIFYVNIIENIMCHFAFSITSICLGIVLLFCYALKFDHIMEQYFLRKISLKTNDSKKGSISCMCPM